MDLHPGAVLDGGADPVDVGEVDARVDALGVEVQRQCGDVDVAGAFPVAEDAALDAFRPGENRQFGAGDTGTSVIVRVHREDHVVAPVEVAVHVLDLVGVDVRAGDLHGGRQIEDDRTVGGGVPQRGHGVAQVQDVVRLGLVEDLGGELEADVRQVPGEVEDVTTTGQDQFL